MLTEVGSGNPGETSQIMAKIYTNKTDNLKRILLAPLFARPEVPPEYPGPHGVACVLCLTHRLNGEALGWGYHLRNKQPGFNFALLWLTHTLVHAETAKCLPQQRLCGENGEKWGRKTSRRFEKRQQEDTNTHNFYFSCAFEKGVTFVGGGINN